ncbi:MAG TPA: gamma-glutamyltransferase family protein [Hyphomicrobiaceae bacterium]|nr:gamma-glutamyltransferase family protein [Hyphomicrobiaceae bacterium]
MANINAGPFTTRPVIEGTFGVCASTHWIGTAVGMSTLEKGGNAFDAGVAVAFTLQVVEPHLCGPGGDVPVIVWDRRKGKAEVICGQGPAPAGATIKHFRDNLGLDMIPGTGLLPACIPGTFETYMMILRDYGTMRLRDVLEPALGYATGGHPLVERACTTIDTVKDLFRNHWPTSAAVYLPGGDVPQPGTLFRNPQHAETYQRILREAESGGGGREAEIERARKAWSHGFVAETIDRFCRTHEVMDVSGRPHKGVLTADDMARWQPTIEAPLSYEYGRFTVLKPGPWTQGPVLLQMLAILKGFDLDKLSPTDPDFIHLWVEAAKLAYADREAFYGDPSFTKVPMDVLLSERYNSDRRRQIGLFASMEQHPGKIDGYSGRVIVKGGADKRASVSAAGAGEPTVGEIHTGHGADHVSASGVVRGDTVHIDVIDRQGNMFTATPSGGWLQSSPVIPELGWPLGSRGQMFWLEEGQPSSLEPGKRPRSTLSVGMALRDGEPYMSWGTPGGDQQDQWNTQFFLRHVHAGMNLQEAIDAPAWHIEHFPASFWPRTARPGVLVVEDRLPKATIDELRRREHKVEVGPAWSEGRLTAVSQEGPRRRAAANPRGMQGYAAGR